MSLPNQWNEVVITKRRADQKPKTAAQIAAAQRTGAVVAVPRASVSGASRKVEQDDAETFVHTHIRPEVAQRIQKARAERNLTRAQLAQQLSVKETVLADIENRRAIVDQSTNTILGKLERILQVKLRGDLSKPFEVRGGRK
ncbi:hypothetical protein RCL1_000028 [Eukaryota sp. TZLM3-RCL]